MSKTIAVHVRYKSWYVSLPFPAKQQREMTKFCVVYWTCCTWSTTANFWCFHFELREKKKMAMDRPHFEEACHQHHPPVPWMEPSRGQAEGQTEEVLEKDNSAGIWGLGDGMGGSETNCKKLGPMKGCGGSPMLWSERRGLIKLIKLTFLNWMLSMHI